MRGVATILVWGLLCSGCTLASEIDACAEPDLGPETWNQLLQGDQVLPGAEAVSPIPEGGALVVYNTPAENDLGLLDNLRLQRLGGDGSVIGRGPGQGDTPVTDEGTFEVNLASLAPPLVPRRSSILVYSQTNRQTIQAELVARAVNAAGILGSPEILRTASLATTPFNLSVTPLDENRYFLLWSELALVPATQTTILGAVAFISGLNTLPVAAASDGTRIVGVPLTDPLVGPLTAIRLSDERVLLAWSRLGGSAGFAFEVHTRVFDVVAERFVGEDQGPLFRTLVNSSRETLGNLTGVADEVGDQVLLVWTVENPEGRRNVYGAFVDRAGNLLWSEGSEDGQAFVLSEGRGRFVDAVAFPGGGVAAVWSETRDATARVRLQAWDAQGRRQFLRTGCGTGPALLFASERAAVGDVSATILPGPEGALLVGFVLSTDQPENLPSTVRDTVGLGVVGVRVPLPELLP